jgi:glutamate dehydrogenase/leucine dehydrogenase
LPSLLPWQQAQASEQKPAATASVAARGTKLAKVELSFSTGQRVVVSGKAVVGRKPAQTAAATGAQAIELLDDTRSVSRVHLYFELDGGRMTVADAGSSNGSSIERSGQQIPLQGAGAPVEVAPGDRVWVGDISFELRPAA